MCFDLIIPEHAAHTNQAFCVPSGLAADCLPVSKS